VTAWIARLAEPVANPGGGAAAGVMLGVAAGLLSMVGGYTTPDAGGPGELDALRARARESRRTALRAADDDAQASQAFAAAFRMAEGPARSDSIRAASVGAAESAARLGNLAIQSITDAEWLGEHGNPILIADVAVAAAALRATVSSARTNVGVDLAALLSLGDDARTIEVEHPQLWASIAAYDEAIARIDRLVAALDDRIVPTHQP
jgi:formiminotetrahydrofolate cyclodeaminase